MIAIRYKLTCALQLHGLYDILTIQTLTWLQQKYQSLDVLNRAWYRTFSSWDVIPAPKFISLMTYTEYIDWIDFIMEKLAQDLRWRHDTVRQADHHTDHTLAGKSARHLSWGGAAFGLTLHTLIDGIALAASVEAEALGKAGAGLLGLGTFLVIILHKPFDAMAITTLMAAGGWSKRARHWVNAGFALVIPVGVLSFHFGANQFAGSSGVFLGSALAFAAGTFLCIAASDLLPELQFHAHDRFKLSFALAAGLLFAVVIGRFETSGHDHHQPSPAADHPHEGPPSPLR